jgi:hypothetical protein
MAQSMGFGILASPNAVYKRKNRWLMKIDGIADDGTSALPPAKGARPSLTFKEMEAQHLNETIYYPSKTEWKPIQLTLYDLNISSGGCTNKGKKVFDWVKKVYDPENGGWVAPCDVEFKKDCRLEMYDGCGEILETWIFENAWPQVVEWGELDMSEGNIVMLDITLRYDRAYLVNQN